MLVWDLLHGTDACGQRECSCEGAPSEVSTGHARLLHAWISMGLLPARSGALRLRWFASGKLRGSRSHVVRVGSLQWPSRALTVESDLRWISTCVWASPAVTEHVPAGWAVGRWSIPARCQELNRDRAVGQ